MKITGHVEDILPRATSTKQNKGRLIIEGTGTKHECDIILARMMDKKSNYVWVTGRSEKCIKDYFKDRPQLEEPEHHSLKGYKVQAELKPFIEFLTVGCE